MPSLMVTQLDLICCPVRMRTREGIQNTETALIAYRLLPQVPEPI